MTKTRRSTIKDVAAAADVSISTVSLVMNEKEGVSPATRERVQEAARELGYVPTQAARRLVAQRTGNVGFVLREDHFTHSEPFYTRIFLGTEFEARHQSLYVLLTTIPRAYVPGEDTPRFLVERNVDGLLVAGRVDEAFLHDAANYDVPIVLIDFEADGLPSVLIDNEGGARRAVEHLLRAGHRRVAFLGADMTHPSLQARHDGYRLALEAAGVPVDPAFTVCAKDGDTDRHTGFRLAERLLSLAHRPTAVFCANDALAFGVLDAAAMRGVDVPEALAVVGFDDIEGAARSRPPLSTVRVFKEQLGELALRCLADLIEADSSQRGRAASPVPPVRSGTELTVRASG